MKRILYILVGLVLLNACKPTIEDPIYSGGNFIAFEGVGNTSSLQEGENIELSVMRSTTNLTTPITITYTVNSTYKESGAEASSQFTILGGNSSGSNQVVIPAGEASAKITIQTIENNFLDGEKNINLEITSVTEGTIGYPGPDGLSKSYTLTINDDDCPFAQSSFVGIYNVVETEVWFSGGADVISYTATITIDPVNPLRLLITGLWEVPTTVSVLADPCPQTISYTTQPIANHPTFGVINIRQRTNLNNTKVSEYVNDGSSLVLYGDVFVSAGFFGIYEWKLTKQ